MSVKRDENPAACPETAELTNLRLPNGSLADVRILQVDNVKLYVPVEWLTFWGGGANDWKIGDNFDPVIQKRECPGIVHRPVRSDKPFGIGFRVIDRGRSRTATNFSLESKISEVSFSKPVSRNYIDQIMEWPTTDYPSAYIAVVPGTLVAIYHWPKELEFRSAEWNLYRDSVRDLAQWVMTPPRDRDNDRIFKLGVAEQ